MSKDHKIYFAEFLLKVKNFISNIVIPADWTVKT